MLRVALEKVVAGGGDEQRARAERQIDLVREQPVVAVEAEAHVDHARARVDRVLDALDHVADEHRAAVPFVERGLRVDAEDADAVVGRGDHGADGGAVLLVASSPGRLGVQQGGVGPAGKLRVADVEPGVDHRDRLAGRRRWDPVRADGSPPPLQADERVRGHSLRNERTIRFDHAGDPSRGQLQADARRFAARQPPDSEPSRDERAARHACSRRGLDEREAVRAQRHQLADARTARAARGSSNLRAQGHCRRGPRPAGGQQQE